MSTSARGELAPMIWRGWNYARRSRPDHAWGRENEVIQQKKRISRNFTNFRNLAILLLRFPNPCPILPRDRGLLGPGGQHLHERSHALQSQDNLRLRRQRRQRTGPRKGSAS